MTSITIAADSQKKSLSPEARNKHNSTSSPNRQVATKDLMLTPNKSIRDRLITPNRSSRGRLEDEYHSPSQQQIQDLVDTAMMNFIKQSIQNVGIDLEDAERAVKE